VLQKKRFSMENDKKIPVTEPVSDLFKSERMEVEEAEARMRAAQRLTIPAQYRADDTAENRVIYALSRIGDGSAEDVGIKVSELDTSIEPGGFSHLAEPVLRNLGKKGLIGCRTDREGRNYYFIPKSVNQAVRYDHFGHVDRLYIAALPKPAPKTGEVLVRVKATGTNPGESAIREGRLEKEFPSKFPSGQGTDFAGIIEALGDGVAQFKVGDEVIGFTNDRNAQADYVAVKADQLVPRPPHLSWEAAGGLFVVGTTAYAAIAAVDPKAGETLIVSGAAGGVGSLVVQMAKKRGATVIGLASEPHHQWLKDHHIIPLTYGQNNEANINAALKGRKADAFIDTSGKGYVELAIQLGIAPDRINTIIDFEAAEKYKVKTDGNAAAGNAKVLAEVARLISDGDLEIPIAKTYPLSQVKEAYRELEKHHTLGKIILIP
jgi:NADPH:quinone reductase-like Zn-dependent oxidoreductase